MITEFCTSSFHLVKSSWNQVQNPANGQKQKGQIKLKHGGGSESYLRHTRQKKKNSSMAKSVTWCQPTIAAFCLIKTRPKAEMPTHQQQLKAAAVKPWRREETLEFRWWPQTSDSHWQHRIFIFIQVWKTRLIFIIMFIPVFMSFLK